MKDTVNISRNPTLIKNLSQQAESRAPAVAVEEPGSDGLTYEQRSKFYMEELRNLKTLQRQGAVIAGNKARKTGLEDYSAFKAKDGLRLEMEEYVAQKQAALPQTHSLIINPEDRKKEVTKIKDKNMTRAQRLVKYMNSKTYFKNLFPLIKGQKPGKDYYARITFWQFIICLYLINYYTDLDARGTQNLENTNQFSFNMVIMLFIQVAVMIIERYIARTNTRVSRRGEDVRKFLQNGKATGTATTMNNTGNKTLTATVSQTFSTRRMTSMVSTLKTGSAQEGYQQLEQYT